ncbi:MAG: hypothetical protein IKD73_01835, partial [Selenomonadaceae bacterium]|nr:hypothetical protein [Selenomonadaceae bacterium]
MTSGTINFFYDTTDKTIYFNQLSNMTFNVSYTESGSTTVDATTTNIDYTVDSDGYLSAVKTITQNGIVTEEGTWIYKADSISSSAISAEQIIPGSDDFIQALTVDSAGVLTISNDVLSKMIYNSATFVDSSSLVYSKSYADIKTDNTDTTGKTYILTKNSASTAAETNSIVISDGLTVIMDADFVNVPITVSGNVFASTDTLNGFTVPSNASDGTLSIGGSQSISLISGSLKTATSNQSITSTNNFLETHTIFNYSDSNNNNDGIILSKSSDSVVTVSDIDDGESFNIDGSTARYYRSGNNLFQSTGSGNTTTYKLYNSTPTTDDADDVYVDLASLTADKNWDAIIAPNSNGVLDIGSSNTYSALVYDSVTKPTTKYASLISAGDGDYTLSTISGSDATLFTAAVSTISLSGGKTVLYSSLALDETIATANTTFKVTAASDDTFSVSSGTDSSPTITGATAITLISGSITATRNQSITLGDGGNTVFKVTSPADISINFNGSKATVTGAVGDSFTIQKGSDSAVPYNVVADSEDTMTFTIDNTGEVTISGLDEINDVLGYNGYNHSVRSAGFVRGLSGSYSLYGGTNGHSLTNESVTTTYLDEADNWSSLVTLSSDDKSITITPTDFTFPSMLIDSDFTSIFGSISGDSTSYTLSKSSSEPTLSKIHIANNNVANTLSLGSGFTSVSITSANSSLNVTDATSSGYQVLLSSTGTSLSGARAASLISGSLTTSQDSLTVSVGDYSVAATTGNEITLIAGSNVTSIAGVSSGESFKVDNEDYLLSAVGLVSNNKLLSNTKPSGTTAKTFTLSQITGSDNWGDMIAPNSSGVLAIPNTTVPAFVVDNTDSPTSLFAELTTVTGGYALTISDDYDGWNNAYAININATKLTLTGGFSGTSIKGATSGAAFTTNSDTFIVEDAESGVIITSASNITQTAGLIASSVGQSITNGNNSSIIANSAGDGFKVSVASSAATIDGLNTGDIFTINGTDKYSITALGLVTGNKFWRASATETISSVTLTDLGIDNNWIGIASVNSSNELVIPPTQANGITDWIVIDSQNTKYGLLTSIEGGYSLSGGSSYTSWDDGYTISVDDTTITLSSDFKNSKITGENSGAAFTVDNLSGGVFTVVDSSTTGSASITGARQINQTAGIIALSSSRQSIVAGSHTISGVAGSTQDSIAGLGIISSVKNGNVTIGALNTGDSFIIDGNETYTLLSNGRFQRSDNLLWSGDTVATSYGSIALDDLSNDTWNGLIKANNGTLSINSTAVTVFDNVSSAFIVSDTANPTTIYGKLTKGDDGYTLSSPTTRDASLSSITVDLEKVTFTRDLLDTTIKAGETEFMATKAPTTGFTVNYSNDEVSIDDATAISLLSGGLTLTDSNQTVTSNGNTIQVDSGDGVSVDYDSETVTIANIATENESVTINGYTYKLLSGDGFTIEITDDGTDNTKTTLKGLNNGDKFTITDSNNDYYTFTYTDAGLTKSQANKSTSSYILTTLTPKNNQLTLGALWEDTDWLGFAEAPNGAITIDNTLSKGTSILVDSIDAPTKNYGKITYSDDNGYTLSDYEDAPASITVKSTTATISSEFSKISLTATSANKINLTTLGDDTYSITGTVSSVDIENKTFTPVVGDSFTVNDTAYLMTNAGLTKTDSNEIWTTADVTSYILPTETDGTWSNIVELTSKGVLDFSSVTVEAGNNVIVTNDLSARRATITATDSLYDLSATDTDNRIATIKLTSTTPAITTDFATTVQTDGGTYTVNGKAYTTTDGLTIYVTSTSSTLNTGTVTLTKDAAAVTATTSQTAIFVTDDDVTITATATNGVWTSLGNLDAGDTFTIGDTTYKVFGTTTLAKLDSSGEIDTLYNGTITNATLNYNKVVDDDNYDSIISLNASSQLDLTKTYTIATTAVVVGVDTSGDIDPTNRIAQLAYNDDQTGYVLSSVDGGNINNLAAVLLNSAYKIFSTTLDTTVTTVGIESFTVNDKNFNAQNALTIETESGNAYLTNGKVKLEDDVINTRTTTDETITATTGSLIVTVSDNTTVTISDLEASEAFTYGSSTYTMSSAGLVTSNKINPNAATTNSITTAELVGDDWKTIWQATDGALNITSAVPAEAYVVDYNASNPSGAVNYGKLTKGDDGYTFTQSTALSSITVDGVKVTLPSDCAGVSITAKGATFSVTASDAFTIDATSTTLGISDVTAVTLTSGTIPATTDIPITANGNVITQTEGDGLTVTVDGDDVTVGSLNTGDKFTVGTTTYEMTEAGLLDTTNQELLSDVTTSYTLGTDFTPIIAVESDG